MIDIMATMLIRNLPDETKRLIRIRAAENGRSMEEEVRSVLVNDFKPKNAALPKGSWVEDIVAMFQDVGGIDLERPPRQHMRDPVDFSGPEYGR